ncbi:aminodeoxychorismate lyase [Salinicola endophyticus]|uniref:Aminodeoxychorismate lyase n=1 Tax=Salinicola endophyticus TaxID=1949083 RepID=A0ABY8FJW4_9GAMM|nr:aminodeoxychorismate lyase [Salinicola endophyticus]WFF43093.1 aminodeoxychorismate lyase [Salinicola endophyticus]
MQDLTLLLDDRGFAYGDGLFETVLVRDGRALLWEAHLARLAEGCARLGLPAPPRDRLDPLPAACAPGLQVLKLVVTRGSGGRGYRPPAEPTPRWGWSAAAFSPTPQRWFAGVEVRLCALRLGRQPRLAGLKHLARLENVLARQEWDDDIIAEGLMCDSEGYLVEATAMNLVWLHAGRLETPLLDQAGVAGTLLAALDAETPLQRVRVEPQRLQQAEAAWVCNSVQGVWPIRVLRDAEGAVLRRWDVASDDPLRGLAHPLLGYPVGPDA